MTCLVQDWGVRRVALASLGAAAPRGTEPALAALKAKCFLEVACKDHRDDFQQA